MNNENPAVKARNTAAAEPSLEDLQQQFKSLKSDLSALSSTVMSIGAAKTDAAIAAGTDRASALAHRGKAAIDQVEDSFGTVIHDVEKSVRAKPFTALAISAALGLVFGLYTAQRK
jgi:ElaB/YqjD/DUF883 family membrane-anchored ribosome-binding protein